MADSKEKIMAFLDEAAETIRRCGLTENMPNEKLNED